MSKFFVSLALALVASMFSPAVYSADIFQILCPHVGQTPTAGTLYTAAMDYSAEVTLAVINDANGSVVGSLLLHYNNTPPTTQYGTLDVTFPSAGTYHVRTIPTVIANGNVVIDNPSFTVLAGGSTPPVLTVTAGASNGITGQPVAFVASASMSGATYSWSGAVTGSTAMVNGTFTTAGSYTATVTVTSGTQTATATATTVITTAPATAPLTVTAGASAGITGQPVAFVASASMSGATYSWSGAVTGSTAMVNGTFTTAGSYTATVTATVGTQSVTATATSVVTTAPLTPPQIVYPVATVVLPNSYIVGQPTMFGFMFPNGSVSSMLVSWDGGPWMQADPSSNVAGGSARFSLAFSTPIMHSAKFKTILPSGDFILSPLYTFVEESLSAPPIAVPFVTEPSGPFMKGDNLTWKIKVPAGSRVRMEFGEDPTHSTWVDSNDDGNGLYLFNHVFTRSDLNQGDSHVVKIMVNDQVAWLSEVFVNDPGVFFIVTVGNYTSTGGAKPQLYGLKISGSGVNRHAGLKVGLKQSPIRYGWGGYAWWWNWGTPGPLASKASITLVADPNYGQ